MPETGQTLALLSDLLGGADVIIWTADPETLAVTHVTDSAEHLLGHPRALWTSGPDAWTHLLPAAERERALTQWRAVALDGRERCGVHRLVGADGREAWFSTRVRALRRPDGTVRRLVGVATDVSAPLLVSREFQDSETLRQLMLDQLPTVAYTTDLQLRFTSGAGAALRQLGLRPHQLAGVSLYQYFHTDDPNHPEIERHRRAAAGESFTYDTEWHGFAYHVVLQPFRDAAGTIIGTLGVALDVTDRKRAEAERERLLEEQRVAAQQLERHTAQLEAVLNTINDAVVACAADGRITLWNHAASRLLGWDGRAPPGTIAELPGRARMLRRDGRPLSAGESALMRAMRGEENARNDVVVAAGDGGERDAYLRATAGPIRDAGGSIVGAVVAVNDMTDAAEFERARARFVSLAAHELKTPVAIMKGHAQRAARTREPLPASVREALDAVQRGADRIDRVVQALLDVSQLDLGCLMIAREPADLSAVAAAAVRRASLRAPAHPIRVVRADPAPVSVDVYRIGTVLANLLDNAVRFSPAGGAIDVSVTREGDRAVLAVRDHGLGIPADRQARIFERYYRAHAGTGADYGGLGVGLYTSREIVARHGGSMWFESPGPGGGSVFFVSLPTEAEHAERSTAQVHPGG